MNDTIPQPPIESFSQYLTKLGISELSFKNYKSDVSHFGQWIILRLKNFGIMATNLNDAFPYLNTKVAIEYKDFLKGGNVGVKTINRRLSTLRHLSRYLRAKMILSTDFMDNVQNISVYIPRKEKILKIKATSPFFSKNAVTAGTSGVIIELDKPLQKASQINIWITDDNRQ